MPYASVSAGRSSSSERRKTSAPIPCIGLYRKGCCTLRPEEYRTFIEERRKMFAFIYINVVWFLAGFINGLTSFGGNLFAMPLMSLVMDAKDAIVFGCLVGTAITVTIALFYHRDLPKREFVLALVSSLAGIPAGMAILKVASVKALLFGCGFILVAFLLWQVLAGRMHISRTISMWWVVPTGIVSGIMLSSTSMGGPVLAMYAVLRGWSKEMTLSMLSTMAALTMLSLVGVQWWNGMYTPFIMHHAMWAIPSTVVGVLVSIPVIRRLNPRIFRLLVLAMLAVSAVMLFVRGWQA